MTCEGDTNFHLGGHGRPGVASGESAVPATDALPLNLWGGLVPAEGCAPDHPINEETASECTAPLQTVFLSVRSHEICDGGLPIRKVPDGSQFTRVRDARGNVRLAPRCRYGAPRSRPRAGSHGPSA